MADEIRQLIDSLSWDRHLNIGLTADGNYFVRLVRIGIAGEKILISYGEGGFATALRECLARLPGPEPHREPWGRPPKRSEPVGEDEKLDAAEAEMLGTHPPGTTHGPKLEED